MNKEGFTLVELLAVVAIIAILSVIVVPSIMNINSNINERSYESKKTEIENAAVLYANNHEELFNGTNEVIVHVYELVDNNYFKTDADIGKGKCIRDENNETKNTAGETSKGCVINPTNNNSMNKDYVVLTREGAGVTAKYIEQGDSSDIASGSNTSKTLVDAVCASFVDKDGKANGVGKAMTGKNENQTDSCMCVGQPGNYTKLITSDGKEVNACLFSGEMVNNYLKYGDSKANWRVLGVYNIGSELAAKMITIDPI